MHKKIRAGVTLCLVLVLSAGGVIAVRMTSERAVTAAGHWQELNPTNTGPGARRDQSMAFHEATQRLYLFGGRDGSSAYNDVWMLELSNLSSLTWQRLGASSPAKPLTRHSAISMIDDAGQYLYIATGQRFGGTLLNDVWRLNLSTQIWQNVSSGSSGAGTAPMARYGSGGGKLNGNLIVTHGFGSTRYDDTWLYNTGTLSWQKINTIGDVPLKRCLVDAATLGNTLILHGGCASGFGPCPLDDTWILDTSTSTWAEVNGIAKPDARQHQSLVAFEDSDQLILFGGDASTSSDGSSPLNDVWRLDLNTHTW